MNIGINGRQGTEDRYCRDKTVVGTGRSCAEIRNIFEKVKDEEKMN